MIVVSREDIAEQLRLRDESGKRVGRKPDQDIERGDVFAVLSHPQDLDSGPMPTVTAQEEFKALVKDHIGPRLRDLHRRGSGANWVSLTGPQWVVLWWQKDRDSTAASVSFTANLSVIAEDAWDAENVPKGHLQEGDVRPPSTGRSSHTGRVSEVKSRSSGDVRGALESAAHEQTLVRVSRSIRRSDKIDGFVVGLGRAWALLAQLDGTIQLNGHTALRLGDVSKVERRGGPESFVGRALAARGQWPPIGADVDLDSVAALVRTAGDVAPLVTLHVEEDDPTICCVGDP